MRQQKENEGGMFSKNTHVLRNHTRNSRTWGRKHMREPECASVSEWGVGVEIHWEIKQ